MLEKTLETEAEAQSTVSTGVQIDPETGKLNSPYCQELRSKKFYFLQQMPTEEHHLLDATRHCWCRRTMQAAGPDGERVQPADCRPGRSCYVSFFAE